MAILDKLLDLVSPEPEQKNFMLFRRKNTCIRCGKKAIGFRDDYGRLGYFSSALRQSCQDEFYDAEKLGI